MGRLAGLKVRDVTRRPRNLGFAFEREGVGSHEVWRHPDQRRFTLVRHVGDYPEGLLRGSLAEAGIDVADFLNAK